MERPAMTEGGRSNMTPSGPYIIFIFYFSYLSGIVFRTTNFLEFLRRIVHNDIVHRIFNFI